MLYFQIFQLQNVSTKTHNIYFYSILKTYNDYFSYNKDENIHRFALSAIRGKLLERKIKREREREEEKEKERKRKREEKQEN